MARYRLINPNLLTGMKVVNVPDQEVLLSDRMAKFVALWKQYDPPMGAVYDVEALEFDPIKIANEALVTPHLNVLTRINHAARAVTLAFAAGTDLDAIASRYPGGVPREPSEIYATGDSVFDMLRRDARYRERIWLSPNTLAAAGNAESYEYWVRTALSSFRNGPRDVTAEGHRYDNDATAVITAIMEGDSPALTNPEIIAARRILNDEKRSALTDVISVRSGVPVDVNTYCKVWLYPWADRPSSMQAIIDGLNTYREEQYYLGTDYTDQGLKSASNVTGVHHVEFPYVTKEVISASPQQFIRSPKADAKNVVYQGTDE